MPRLWLGLTSVPTAYGDAIGFSGVGFVRFRQNRPEMDDETASLSVQFVPRNALPRSSRSMVADFLCCAQQVVDEQ